MNKLIPTIDKIRSRKSSKKLIKDINVIGNWYDTNILFSETNSFHPLLCDAYKCLTLAISRHIAKYSSPLSMKTYEIKYLMERRILSEEFLDTNKPTYEWLIDTFQYAANIPADTPNSTYTQINNKQVCVNRNLNYAILNKLALLVKDRDIPFTIDFNSIIIEYNRYLTPNIDIKFRIDMAQLVFIQILKNEADSNIRYTLFEEVIDEKLKELLALNPPANIMKPKKPLRKTIQAMKDLQPVYLKHLTK